MKLRRNPKLTNVNKLHKTGQRWIWGIASGYMVFVFLTVMIADRFVPVKNFVIVGAIAIELSFIVFVIRSTSAYFLGDEEVRKNWLVPAIVLFTTLTFPFVCFQIVKMDANQPDQGGILMPLQPPKDN